MTLRWRPSARLRHVNLLIWVLLIGLVLAYRGELAWAVRALPAELRGEGYLTHTHWELYTEARRVWDGAGDAERATELVQRSLAIEPNALPRLLLAEIRRETGDTPGALELYLETIDFDPSQIEAYLGAAETYRLLGRPEPRMAVLQRGLDYFSSFAERFRPRTDPTVWEDYNDKARSVHEGYLRAQRILEARIHLLAAAQEPY